MALSGSRDFSVTRNELITMALEDLGVVAQGQTPTDFAIAQASDRLNMIIKAWQALGIGLWLNKEIWLFPTEGQRAYQLGSTSSDHVSYTAGTTEVKVAGSTGDGTLDVDSTSDMTTGDVVGIELDDGTLQWTTLTVTDSDTITLGAVLTDDVAVDNKVYFYTSLTTRPIEIFEARFVQSDGTEIPMKLISREEYMRLPTKTTQGSPNEFWFDPQMTLADLYIWPTFDTVDAYMKMSAKILIQDFDSITNNPDFPVEWLDCLVKNLSARLAAPYRLPLEERTFLMAVAKDSLEEVRGFDRGKAPVRFQPKIGR